MNHTYAKVTVVSFWLLFAVTLLFPDFVSGQQAFDRYQKTYTDSLYKNPEFAMRVCDTVLERLSATSDRNWETSHQKALWNKQKGTTYYVRKNYEDAVPYYQMSYNLYKGVKDTLGMAKTQSNLGICFEERNLDNDALKYYNKALELASGKKDPFRFTVLNNILSLLLKKELYDKVKREALTTLDENIPNKQTRIAMLSNLGAAYTGLEMYDSAIYYSKQAYALAVEEGSQMNELLLLINLANQHQKKNAFAEARHYLLVAETLNKRYAYAGFNKKIYQTLGIINYKLKQYSEANTYYTKALKLARSESDVYLVVSLLENISRCDAKLHNYQSAYLTLKESSDLKDSLQGIESKKAVAELSAKYRNLEHQNKILRLNNEKKVLKLDAKLKTSTIENQNIKLAKRNWLIFGLGAILVASVISFYLFYSRKKVVAAKSELELKNQKLEIERKLLQSQMNPHFIFNALNSIQRFVSESDSFNAQVYFARFGKLMRNILEQSRKEFISLEEEIETLQLYIDLEQLRFNNSFSATITSSIEGSGEVQIPPMIIQPFVENAILHGFKGIRKDGKLRIHFSEVNNTTILCTIEDNGIGRQKASENTHNSTLKKTSLGTQVTRDRLRAMGPEEKEHIVYEDLSQGTRVKVYIYT